MLDSLTVGVILLSAKGHVLTTNPAAKRLLAGESGLEASRDGLRAESADDSIRLGQLIARATAAPAGAGPESAGFLTLSRKKGPPLQLVVSPVRGFHTNETHPARAIVFIGDAAPKVGPTHETLSALFGLTPAESRLAMLLADGHSASAITQMVGVSRNTLKSQLSSIFQKTGTSRQAQLVRVLLQLPAARPTTAA
jgi:DNA-binding CsgD family transcriptional regulator